MEFQFLCDNYYGIYPLFLFSEAVSKQLWVYGLFAEYTNWI